MENKLMNFGSSIIEIMWLPSGKIVHTFDHCAGAGQKFSLIVSNNIFDKSELKLSVCSFPCLKYGTN